MPGRGSCVPRSRSARGHAQLQRAALVHGADRVVELADAAESRRERDVGRRKRGRGEQRAGGLRAVRPRERERPGAELCGEHAGEVAGRVPESGGEARHALALDDAVGDEAHGACGQVVAQVPLGRAGHRVGQAPLAGTQPGLVGGSGREVEAHVRRLGGDGRAAGAAVDAGGVHAGDELPVEPRVAGLHGAVALGEHGVGERVGDRGGGPREGGGLGRHASSLARGTDNDQRKSDIAASLGWRDADRRARPPPRRPRGIRHDRPDRPRGHPRGPLRLAERHCRRSRSCTRHPSPTCRPSCASPTPPAPRSCRAERAPASPAAPSRAPVRSCSTSPGWTASSRSPRRMSSPSWSPACSTATSTTRSPRSACGSRPTPRVARSRRSAATSPRTRVACSARSTA